MSVSDPPELPVYPTFRTFRTRRFPGPGLLDAYPLPDLGTRLTILACLTTLTFTKPRMIANPQKTLQLSY